MYIFDFMKHTLKRANIPTYIYLVLNVFVIGGILYVLNERMVDYPRCLLIAVVFYFISVCIALTPLGEWILRIIVCAKKTKPGLFRKNKKDYLAELQYLFDEVYDEAKSKSPELRNSKIDFFMNVNDETINAFATGRRTICVNKGIYDLVQEKGAEGEAYVKAILAHEFGHIVNKDTDLLLVVGVGNLFVTIILTWLRVMLAIFAFFLAVVESDIRFAYKAHQIVQFIIVEIPFQIWTFIGSSLCLKSSRDHEYKADEYAFSLGHGQDLATILDMIKGEKGEKGFFANLLATHPDTEDRIARLQVLEDKSKSEPLPLPPEPEPVPVPPTPEPVPVTPTPIPVSPTPTPVSPTPTPVTPTPTPVTPTPVSPTPTPVPPTPEPVPSVPKKKKTPELLDPSTGDDFRAPKKKEELLSSSTGDDYNG